MQKYRFTLFSNKFSYRKKLFHLESELIRILKSSSGLNLEYRVPRSKILLGQRATIKGMLVNFQDKK